jgi:hypothetical protein
MACRSFELQQSVSTSRAVGNVIDDLFGNLVSRNPDRQVAQFDSSWTRIGWHDATRKDNETKGEHSTASLI